MELHIDQGVGRRRDVARAAVIGKPACNYTGEAIVRGPASSRFRHFEKEVWPEDALARMLATPMEWTIENRRKNVNPFPAKIPADANP
jgi:hypothetical protein